MAENKSYTRGQTIVEAGSAMTSLGLVISGRVCAVYPGGAMMLERGDAYDQRLRSDRSGVTA